MVPVGLPADNTSAHEAKIGFLQAAMGQSWPGWTAAV